MDIQVLRFQNKKLGERLEEMKVEEENLKIQIEEYKKRERDNTELLSVIHRAWNQVNFACYYRMRHQLSVFMYCLFLEGKNIDLFSTKNTFTQRKYLHTKEIHILFSLLNVGS